MKTINPAGISGNKLRGNYLNIQDEWFKLHYLFRKANNILFERSGMLKTSLWKYVKFVSWEKSTSHPFIIFESSRWALWISLTLYGFIIGLWRVLRGEPGNLPATRDYFFLGSAFMGSITRSFLLRLVSFILLLYFTCTWINDLQKESNFIHR